LLTSIRNALNGIDLPIPFALDDDHIGTEELRLDSSDLISAGVGIRDKSLTIKSDEGHYELSFQIRRRFPDWQQLDKNSATIGIVVADNNLYQLHNNGCILPVAGYNSLSSVL
jgi:hypothetical protein